MTRAVREPAPTAAPGLYTSAYIERPTSAARSSWHFRGRVRLLSSDERHSPRSARLRMKLPDGTGRRIAKLDARRRQSFADPVGQLPLFRRAQLGPQRDARLHQRGQDLARIAEAERCRFAEAMNERVQDGPRAIWLVRLQRVRRPPRAG